MNELLNRILDLPKMQKIVLLAGVILGLLVADYFFLYSPNSDGISKLAKQIEELQDVREKKKREVDNLPKLLERVRELDVMLKLALAQLPEKREIPDLLSSISSKARESGLEILVFRPRGESIKDFYAEIPVEITVQGGFHNVVTFFDEVGRLSRLVNLGNIEVKAPTKKGEARETLNAATMATTFRFLDDQERAKVAAEKAAKEKKAKK